MKCHIIPSNHSWDISVQTMRCWLPHPPACEAFTVKLTETDIPAPRGQRSPADTAYQLTSRVAESLSGSRQSRRWPRLVWALIYSWKSNCNMAWSRRESWLSRNAGLVLENRWRAPRWGRSWTKMDRMHSCTHITVRKSASILNNPTSTKLRLSSVKLWLPTSSCAFVCSLVCYH